MSGSFADWLFDAFIYTGLLIGLVLVLRRPVARHFGSQVAYALWALPLLRFLMPPIVLPASMAPVEKPVEASEPLMVFISGPVVDNVGTTTTTANTEGTIGAIDLLLPLWLIGAALFLIFRTRDYLRMRRGLLAQARPVGESGKVRLVETPSVSAPVAFGVRDKVVALPPAFMAHHDLTARDMAIAHELAHHRGHDLLANILAQPILALHWFNPLAWWGWRAMRRDQEAACDARVIAGRGRSERAAYAQVIAGFAAGEDLVLAAPMACPVLGEKSIIHRLRSLTMSDVSTRRRRLGIAAITTTALALPLTASISYAHPHRAPAPLAVPQPPAPPLAPDVPAAPAAPDAPLPPAAPAIVSVDPDLHMPDLRTMRRDFDHEDGEFSEQEFEHMMAQVERELGEVANVQERVAMARAEARQAVAQADRAAAQARRAAAEASRVAVYSDAQEGPHSADMRCTGDEPVVYRQLEDGSNALMICWTAITSKAVEGIRQARESVAGNRDMPARTREEILRNLDLQIEQMEKYQQVSFRQESSKLTARAAQVVRPTSIVAAYRMTPPVPPVPRVSEISGVHTTTMRLTAPVRAQPIAQEQCEDEVERIEIRGRSA